MEPEAGGRITRRRWGRIVSTVGAEAIETDKGGPLAGVGDDSSADETVGGKEAITPAERRSTADGRSRADDRIGVDHGRR